MEYMRGAIGDFVVTLPNVVVRELEEMVDRNGSKWIDFIDEYVEEELWIELHDVQLGLVQIPVELALKEDLRL